ncbi:MAG TPA: amidohydrolase family protein [Vicinamibacterales bacterium]|nr:amidohydrolase family protein [Vicinamibacterales bacterium]
MKRLTRWAAIAAAVACCGLLARAADDPVESGQFTLFKFEQAIGEERYDVRADGDLFVLSSTFSFTDRGTPVQLSTTAQFDRTFTPARFTIKGETARITGIDAEVSIGGGTATVREGSESRRAPAPPGAFTLAGYAPPSMQMELVRYWASHGRPSSVPLLPRGSVHIERRGRDQIVVGNRTVALDRYSLSGVVWGRETVWCDETGRLTALVGQDAEFDHFEAVRPELEAAVPQLVARAASDGMAAMAETAAAISPAPSRVIAITGGTVLDMTAPKPILDGTVIVVDGRITAAGPSARVRIPQGAVVVDAKGKTVMPGLWDMHAHFEQVEWGPIYLAAGVTTIRDVGNELDFIVAVRDAVAAGRGIGPRMLLAGIIDGPGPNGLGAVRAATPDEARQRVDRYHDAGFAQIKVYSSISLDVLRAITAEAHRLGMTVTGHVPEGMNAFAAIDAGLDQINHAQYLTAVADSGADRLIAALKKHKTVVDPTLALYELLARPLTQPIDTFEPGIRKVARELEAPLSGFGSSPELAAQRRRQFEDEVAIVGRLHRAGIPIVAGTDQSVPGHSLHRELELYVQAGFSPLEALQSATVVPARVMGKESDSGTIQPGKRGDLVVLDGNPLDDIHNTRRIYRVITGGRVFDPAPLWESVGFASP